MRYPSISKHLKPYGIVARRKTTINHAFAAAIAPSDAYEEWRVREAMTVLGQNPDDDLCCVYCGNPAQTWDHVFATVQASEFSGNGHRLGNLLPCCKSCNSGKGNSDWQRFLTTRGLSESQRQETERRITAYLERFFVQDAIPEQIPEYRKLQQIRQQVMVLLAEADELARIVRERAASVQGQPQPEQRYLVSLFESEPETWGLRGDAGLWHEMAEHLANHRMPDTQLELRMHLVAAFECLTGIPLVHEAPIYLERHSHGGMSSGYVSPEFWREKAIPFLLSRYADDGGSSIFRTR